MIPNFRKSRQQLRKFLDEISLKTILEHTAESTSKSGAPTRTRNIPEEALIRVDLSWLPRWIPFRRKLGRFILELCILSSINSFENNQATYIKSNIPDRRKPKERILFLKIHRFFFKLLSAILPLLRQGVRHLDENIQAIQSSEKMPIKSQLSEIESDALISIVGYLKLMIFVEVNGRLTQLTENQCKALAAALFRGIAPSLGITNNEVVRKRFSRQIKKLKADGEILPQGSDVDVLLSKHLDKVLFNQ